jgi:hypothetical protein
LTSRIFFAFFRISSLDFTLLGVPVYFWGFVRHFFALFH